MAAKSSEHGTILSVDGGSRLERLQEGSVVMTTWRYWAVVTLTATVICAAFAAVRSFLPTSSPIVRDLPPFSMRVEAWKWPDSYIVITTRKDGTKEFEILEALPDKKLAR